MFVQEGLEAVLTLKRSEVSNHARQKITGEDEAKIIQLALSEPPEGHARWSLRLLEKEAKVILEHPIKKDAIGRLFKKSTSTSKRRILDNSKRRQCRVCSSHERCLPNTYVMVTYQFSAYLNH